jgi:Flp pilus assembly pilin Flp
MESKQKLILSFGKYKLWEIAVLPCLCFHARQVRSSVSILGKTKMYQFLKEERGQDLIEYTLLLAFIALAGAVLFVGMGRSITSIWTVVNSRLASAAGGS